MNKKELKLELSVEEFEQEHLIAICRGDKLAIHIPSFATSDVCKIMAERIINHKNLEYYKHAPGIGKLMTAFYEGHSDAKTREDYYNNVNKSTIEFRQLSEPYLNPMDHLRLVLDDLWSYGAVRENIHEKKMAYGLAQVFKEGTCALPHQDFLRMDEPNNKYAQTLLTQLTALVYVQPAEEGGYLELWREHFDHDEFMARKNESTYGVAYSKIPKPSVIIKPGVGDLVIADSTKVHAVSNVMKGNRVAVNCFIGFRGISHPLTYWS